MMVGKLYRFTYIAIRQPIRSSRKKAEQGRRAHSPRVSTTNLRSHEFYEEIFFLWLEITAHQPDKKFFASCYLCIAALAVQQIQKLHHATSVNTPGNAQILTYLSEASIDVSETEVGFRFDKLLALRVENVSSLYKMGPFKDEHVAVVPQDDQSDIDAVEWILNTSYTRMFSSDGMFARAQTHYCSHTGAETRIPYMIQLGGIRHDDGVTLVISNGSDFPAISAEHQALRYQKSVHMVSDQ